MPDFGSPFSGLSLDKKLSKDELVRAIKFMIAAELEATQMYDQVVDATDDENAKKVIKSISDEERVHAGEFSKLLSVIDPQEAKLFEEGKQEAADLMKVSDTIKTLAKKLKDSGYSWEKGDQPGVTTLKYISPFTGKKFHVSP